MNPQRSNVNERRNSGSVGFSMSGTKRQGVSIPPPSFNLGSNKQGYQSMTSITESALSANWGLSKKRSKTEEEYFDDDDDQPSSSTPMLQYLPAPGSPSSEVHQQSEKEARGTDSEEDPLDVFMASIEAEVEKNSSGTRRNTEDEREKGTRADIDTEDNEESYYRYMEENPNAGVHQDDSDQEIEYDEDGNPIPPPRRKEIDPLPPIDHSLVNYEPFESNFYTEHKDIASLSENQVEELRKTLGIKVSGPSAPRPVVSFGHFQFDEPLMRAIRKYEYSQPTPIQAQAVPTALSGRDLIGIAKTGSGKTAAFVWPMLIHILDQRELGPKDGPIGLILAPTRELSQQIYQEAKKFAKVYNIRVCCCYGGGNKWEQSKTLEAGAEVVVATPGRMIDLVKMKATNLSRVTFLVLDEADRMFDMGFEPQVRSICDHVRPNRQTLLFSATFKKRVEKLARDVLSDPIRIVQGDVGEANADVTQHVIVFDDDLTAKWTWLNQNIIEYLSVGSLLIFVTKKINAEELANNLRLKDFVVSLLHGDMDQVERNKVITAFKKRDINILVATDVAARGLDIPHIRTVINYDVARDIDTHTHRIGRTGRAGEKGAAYTLVTERDKEFAGHLVRNLEGASQNVPQDLMELALRSSWFKKSRFKSRKRSQLSVGGAGLGFKANISSDQDGGTNALHHPPKDLKEVVKKLERAGPCSDRLAAMKAAFRSQYNTQFRASSDHTWEQTTISASAIMPPPPPPPASNQLPLEARLDSSSHTSLPSDPRTRDREELVNLGIQGRKKTRKSRWE